MVAITTTPKGAISIIQLIRRITSNRRGPASPQTKAFANQVFNSIAGACENVARQALRSNQSTGPPLKPTWVREKAKSWAGLRWYFTPGGATIQPTKPSFAIGPQHKNVWTGTLESELTSWYNTGGLISGINTVGIGYLPSSASVIHPIKGVDILTLARWAHFGTSNQPPRPFLNTPAVRSAMRTAASSVISRAITNLLTTGRP